MARVDAVPRLCRGVAELPKGPLELTDGDLGELVCGLWVSFDGNLRDLFGLP